MALGLEQALKIVVSAVDNASATLNGIKDVVNTLTSDAAIAAQTLDTIGQGLQSTGRSMTRYVTAPIVGGLTLSTKAATDFEERLTILEVALGDDAAAAGDLGEAAKAMGQDVRLPGVFGATDAIDAMTDITKAGFGIQEMTGDLAGYMEGTAELGGILQAAVLLAAASDLTLGEATNTLITTIHTYGLEASDAIDIANKYVKAADASAASVRDLTDSVAAAGPSLDFYNMDLDDTLTSLAILADRNIKGAQAGTNLRSMQNNLHRGTARTNDALEDLNVTLYDSEGAFRSPLEIIDDVNKAMMTLTDQKLATSVKDLFGTYGQLAGITLGKEGVAGWDEMNDKIAKAASVQEVAEARSGTFAAELGKLKDTIETFMINAGTPFIEDFLRPAVEHLQSFVEKLNDLNPATMDWLIRMSLIAAVVGPALIALGTFARALASILTLYKLIAGAQAAAGLATAGGAAGAGAGAAAGVGISGLALPAAAVAAGAYVGTQVLPEALETVQEKGSDWLASRGMERMSFEELAALERGEVPERLADYVGELTQPTPDVTSMLAKPLPGQVDYVADAQAQAAAAAKSVAPTWTAMVGEGFELVEPPAQDTVSEWAAGLTAIYGDEAVVTASGWVTDFEAEMANYDTVFESIGLGGGNALKTGMLSAVEDAGSEFVITMARQMAPELVPYVLAAIAARAATEEPVG